MGSTGGRFACLSESAQTISALSIDDFKALNIDEKLDSIFLCLQNMYQVNERLATAEQDVRDLRDQTDLNSERLTILAYKSIDAEARQCRNNLIFWGS